MAKSSNLEGTLAVLKAIREDPTSESSLKRLRQIIVKDGCHAVSRAAEIVRDFEMHQLAEELIAAYPRFMKDGNKRDKGCFAKTRIVDALAQTGFDAEDIFREGIRYRQMEPVWGGQTDTAIELRGLCAMGLVRLGCPDAILALTELLNDKEGPARADAARAMGFSCDERAIPLLRFKVMVGDPEPQVVSECLSALLRLHPQDSLPFAKGVLETSSGAKQEAAALALGESRMPEAFECLKDLYEAPHKPALGSTVLTAIAMLRRDDGISFLLSLLKKGTVRDARDALRALRIYQFDEAVRKKVEAAVKKRGHPDLKKKMKEW